MGANCIVVLFEVGEFSANMEVRFCIGCVHNTCYSDVQYVARRCLLETRARARSTPAPNSWTRKCLTVFTS